MNFDRFAWFMAGLIIGNLLNTFTTVTLLSIWLVASNQALPACLGGHYPQDILANFFSTINLGLSLIPLFRKKIAKDQEDQESTKIQTDQSGQIDGSSNHSPTIENEDVDLPIETISTNNHRALNFQVVPVGSSQSFPINQPQIVFPPGGVRIITAKPPNRQSFIIQPKRARIEIMGS